MDQIILELLRYGWQGVVVACMLGLARLLWPGVVALFPKWLTARRVREDRLLKALQQATKAIAEGTAKAEAMQQTLERLCREQAQVGGDVRFIAQQLDQDLRQRARLPGPDAHEAASASRPVR